MISINPFPHAHDEPLIFGPLQIAFQGTAAGGTREIVLNGTTGLLHPVGKGGVMPLARNIVNLASHVERRLTMGKKGYGRVKEVFLEHHMEERIGGVLKDVLQRAKSAAA